MGEEQRRDGSHIWLGLYDQNHISEYQSPLTKSKKGSSSFRVLGRLVSGLVGKRQPQIRNQDSPSTIPVEHPINMFHSIDIIRRQEESRHEEDLSHQRLFPTQSIKRTYLLA